MINIIEIEENLMQGKKPNLVTSGEGWDCWISGGAIRSWFNGEKTRDIDVFFKSNVEMESFINSNCLKNKLFE